jgi:protein phosphatase
MSKILYAGLSDPGRLRRHNEDRWLADPGLGLYVVADGLGGIVGGERAAELAVQYLPHYLRKHLRGLGSLGDARTTERILAAFADLCQHVRQEGLAQPRLKGMGTTVVAALVWDRQALIAHLGDSRAYLLRDGGLEQLTRDHSPIQRLLDRGEITPEQVAGHPAAGQLTRYVGMRVDTSPDLRLLDLQPGDQLLLCSDGLTEMLTDSELTALLRQRLPPHEACQRLVETANAAGGHDNVTVVVVAVHGGP